MRNQACKRSVQWDDDMYPFGSFRDMMMICPLSVEYLNMNRSPIASMNFNDHLASRGKRACEGN